jgi:hypothetical protein
MSSYTSLDPAVHDAGRLAPQDRRGAVTGLPGERGLGDAVEPGKHPQVTAIMKAWCEDGRRTGSRSGTGHDVRGAKTAHSTHHQVVVPPATGVWSSDIAYHQTLTCRHCAANAQPGPILPGHLASRSCFPGRSPRQAKRPRRHPPRIRPYLSVRWKGQVTGTFTALADY